MARAFIRRTSITEVYELRLTDYLGATLICQGVATTIWMYAFTLHLPERDGAANLTLGHLRSNMDADQSISCPTCSWE
jgi:hypothetical protein